MELKTEIRKIGTSLGIIIHHDIIEQANLKEGDTLCLDFVENKIIVRKCK